VVTPTRAAISLTVVFSNPCSLKRFSVPVAPSLALAVTLS
jgi:hypothetical protein